MSIESEIIYLFHIKLKNEKYYYLTSSNLEIAYKEQKYLPYSGLSVLSGKFNDSAKNHVILHGIFDPLGIKKEDDIAGSIIKIMHSFEGSYRHFVTYICTEYNVYDLEFKIKCEPESIKYNQSLLQMFSKKCRANFGDSRCKINVDDYVVNCNLLNQTDNTLCCDIEGYDDGYFQDGMLSVQAQNMQHKFKIIAHSGRNIEIANISGFNFTSHQQVTLRPSCNKNFRTCCDYFNNAINFRGEPDIPEYDTIKN